MARTDLWTREELIVVFNQYLKLPFGKLDKRTKEVKELAYVIGRTDNAVAMRLNNYAHVDPYHQQRGIVGLANGVRQYNQFGTNLSTIRKISFLKVNVFWLIISTKQSKRSIPESNLT